MSGVAETSILTSAIALIRYKLNARRSRQKLLDDISSPIGQIITMEEVSWHDKIQDCWIIIYDRVYDVTDFLDQHPGGADLLLEYAGRDASVAFRGSGHSQDSLQMLTKYYVGDLPIEERIFRKANGYQLSDMPL